MEWVSAVVFLLIWLVLFLEPRYESYVYKPRPKLRPEPRPKTLDQLVQEYAREHNKPKTIYVDVESKQKYLKTEAWNIKRKQVLKRDVYQCRQCGTTGIQLEVHHLHYRRLYDEDLLDLVSVCRACHQSIHDEYGYDYNNTFPILRRDNDSNYN